MRLVSLHLQNIRSYVDERITFPEGMTLLAGDIGSGKSTLLLAVEFALFGIQRGELSGAALLRHGSQKGEVTLEVEIADKRIRITRRLKRNANAIAQDAGVLELDGAATDCTAQELKARVLELLRYPASLVRGKGNLFRYTVYTPQEQMKAILEESAEQRLDTLRKLFGIDKYKRVSENAQLLLREMRKQEMELAARIETLRSGLADGKALRVRLEQAKQKRAAVMKAEAAAKKTLATLTKESEAREKERFAYAELQKRHAILVGQLTDRKQRIKELSAEQKRFSTQITETEAKLAPGDADPKALAKEATLLAEQARKIAEKEHQALRQEAELEGRKARSRELASSIAALDKCPTCKQFVDQGHKQHIKDAEAKIVAQCEEKLAGLVKVKAELRRHWDVLERKQAEHLQRQRLVEANKVKLANLAQLKLQRQALLETLARLDEERVRASEEIARLAKEIAARTPVDEEASRELRGRLEAQRHETTKLSVRAAELAKDETRAAEELERLEVQLARIKEWERGRALSQRRIAWLTKHLIPVGGAIEKHLFHAVHGAFNEFFREWFGILIEDESLTVRLDGSFAPVVVQDGYESDVAHLSGGERTSVALAYRLSLTKAINEFLTHINTKDLLVLDEPTDGFSSEQLGRVRDVLLRLGLKQVIVVSHEEQLEGYADHVLRIRKVAHESRLA